MSELTEYRVLARSLRPQTFAEVLGQDRVKQTLKNAFLMNRLGHAYLFSGSHGIGKTTLARLFAKLLNCHQPKNAEPCNSCPSCQEIQFGSSLDVVEIDGASNRGIDDIRQINESASFTSNGNKCKIFILDEVHMLTKEAFNALLKTLEDPPLNVKFLFATTEPHKVPTTVLSRCQCFLLRPLSPLQVANHIKVCLENMNYEIDSESCEAIAQNSHGSLRDALVTTDQLLSYCGGKIDLEKTTHFLGLLPQTVLFEFDKAAKQEGLKAAFRLAEKITTQGVDLTYFLSYLLEHFKQILKHKVLKNSPSVYDDSAQIYSQEQCTHILDLILELQGKIKFAPSKQIALENLLIQIAQSHSRVSLRTILSQLDALKNNATILSKETYKKTIPQKAPPKNDASLPTAKTLDEPRVEKKPPTSQPALEPKSDAKKQNICYNTLMQFAAVELEGTLKKEGM